LMGSDPKKDRYAQKDEQPQHVLELGEYYLGRYPVTAAQFGEFVRDGGYARERYWKEAIRAGRWKAGKYVDYDGGERVAPYDFGQPFNLPNHPVVGVTWYEALAYCRWLGEQLSAFSRQRLAES
jgi:formylglycine-generating enzyme required for sulfatase activity